MATDFQDTDDDRPALASALRDLLQSEGWRWLCQEAERDYGPAGYGRRVNAAIAAIPSGPDRPYEIARVTEKIHDSCEAVNAFIKRPKDVLASLTKQPVSRPFESWRRTLGTHR